MNISLPEIATLRARLREEIMEREYLLAALDVAEKYAARGHAPHSMDLGSLVAALLPSRPTVELRESPAFAPPALPPKSPVKRYIHPELSSMRSNVGLVRWALERLPEEFTLHDIAALLKREGYDMKTCDISVVLTRMKRQRTIQEIRRSYGPKPSLLRKAQGIAAQDWLGASSAREGGVSLVTGANGSSDSST